MRYRKSFSRVVTRMVCQRSPHVMWQSLSQHSVNIMPHYWVHVPCLPVMLRIVVEVTTLQLQTVDDKTGPAIWISLMHPKHRNDRYVHTRILPDHCINHWFAGQ